MSRPLLGNTGKVRRTCLTAATHSRLTLVALQSSALNQEEQRLQCQGAWKREEPAESFGMGQEEQVLKPITSIEGLKMASPHECRHFTKTTTVLPSSAPCYWAEYKCRRPHTAKNLSLQIIKRLWVLNVLLSETRLRRLQFPPPLHSTPEGLKTRIITLPVPS